MRAGVVRVCRVHFDNCCIDDEGNAEEEAAEDLQWPTSKRVDSHNANRSANEGDDCVDGLE